MGLSSFIYFICVITISLADEVVQEKCLDDGQDFCITLYKSNQNKTWYQAKDECRATGKYLARIENKDIRNLTVQVLGVADNSIRNPMAWVAGRRSSNDRLQTLEGQKLPSRLNITNLNQPGENCLTALYSNGAVEFAMDNCDERDGNLHVICSTNSTAGECRGQRKVFVNDKCYIRYTTKISTNGNQRHQDWFRAQNLCHNRAARLITDYSSNIFEKLNMANKMWLGFSRKQWNWVHQDNHAYVTVNAENPKPTDPIQPFTDTSTHSPFDVNTGATSLETEYPLTSTTPRVSTEETANAGARVAIYAGAAISGVAVITGIVVAIVCIMRRKQQKRVPRLNSTSQDIHQGDIELQSDDRDEDTVTPFAEFAGGHQPSNESAQVTIADVTSDYGLAVPIDSSDTDEPRENIQAPDVYASVQKSRHEMNNSGGEDAEDDVVDNPLYGAI